MSIEHAQLFCGHCNKQVLAICDGPNHILHLILTIITGGLWGIVWVLVSFGKKEWRCSHCGTLIDESLASNQRPDVIKIQPHRMVKKHGENHSIVLPLSLIGLGLLAIIISFIRKDVGPLFASPAFFITGYIFYRGR